jgi:excisionase family DNA binding protein
MDDVVARFGVSRHTVRRWVKRKYFSCVKPNARTILLERASVDQWEKKIRIPSGSDSKKRSISAQ